MGYYDNYPSYTPVGEQKAKHAKQIEKLKKKNPNLAPIVIEGRTLAKSWWAKAWNKNLESYADYSNRLSRGRSYLRTNAVLDLQIETGIVKALVQGSRRNPYKVEIAISPLKETQLEAITTDCDHKIKDLEELFLGKFPKELAKVFTLKGKGLFPTNTEIDFSCSCPDWANMCKHVTAVLYGIGTRFDDDPTLFFKLRNIDFARFLSKTIEQKMESMLKNAGKPSPRVLDDDKIIDLFGL